MTCRVNFVNKYRRNCVCGVSGEIVARNGVGLIRNAAMRQSVRSIFKLETAAIEEFVDIFRGRRAMFCNKIRNI